MLTSVVSRLKTIARFSRVGYGKLSSQSMSFYYIWTVLSDIGTSSMALGACLDYRGWFCDEDLQRGQI